MPERSRPGWWRPRGIAGQLTIVVVAAIVAAHIIGTMTFFLLREQFRSDDHPMASATRIAMLARMLDMAEPGERDVLLRGAARALPALRVGTWDGGAPEGAGDPGPDHPVIDRLRSASGLRLAMTSLDAAGETARGRRVGIVTPSGARFRASVPDEEALTPRRAGIIFSLTFLALTLILLFAWATRALTAPLAKLADAAEAFGTRGDLVALPEDGPAEVLAVSRALDRMRDRVRRLLDDRTEMLAAISHDLRTPITRLRLRAEFIEDDHARAMTLRDLDQMNGLVEAALSFVRDGQNARADASALIDLASVVQTVCDGFADIGADVQVDQPRHVLVQGRPDELQRAIMNLVDNAVKYGGSARVRMGPAPDGVSVEVIDDGPGIPESERDAMVQPFVRGDRSRNLNEASGFGLGLSIVLAIVEAHGGRLTLENRQPRGFCARIDLPLAATRIAARTETAEQDRSALAAVS